MRIQKLLKNLPMALLILLGGLISASPAQAFTLSARGAYGFGSGAGSSLYKTGEFPILSGELTFGLGDTLQVGAFYQAVPMAGKTLGTTNAKFYGAIARAGLPGTGFFSDLSLGMTTAGGSDSAFGYGVGAGYRIALAPLFTLSPRVGYTSLPIKVGALSSSRNTFDLGLMFSLSI